MRRITVFALLICVASGAKSMSSHFGRVCGFGDFNNDRNTDIIVQIGQNLTVLLQDDKLINVLEDGVFKNSSTFVVGSDVVECSLGDFNGDSYLDVLVSAKAKHGYKHTLWLADPVDGGGDVFKPTTLDLLGSQAMAVDVDGDGNHDVLGFLPNGSLYCRRLSSTVPLLEDCTYRFINFPEKMEIYPGMAHLYVDIMGNDLVAELVFMLKGDGDGLKMDVWRRQKDDEWHASISQIPLVDAKYVGTPVAADFDADRQIEILVPVCKDEACTELSHFAVWQRDRGFKNTSVDLLGNLIHVEPGSKVVCRVGDYSLDGYPDLLIVVDSSSGEGRHPGIIENKECKTTCAGNETRKFEFHKPQLVQKDKELILGMKTMMAFFDLKEDGNLDILVEYTYNGMTKFSFMTNDEQGDTTFLKVQVFTPSCANRCNKNSNEPGSGISWSGSCMYFTMSDGWGGSLQSTACQLAAQTHRSLSAPYVLFGLGRSPNFVDELVVGTPRYDDRSNSPFRQHMLKQIVPNSRIIMLPPAQRSGHWQTRLYVTPSQLIIQSLVVIAIVCAILMMVASLLHWREKKEDRVERQQQSHRFHFDAM